MLILPEGYEAVIENIEKLLPEAENRVKTLSIALEKSDINRVIENMVNDEPDLAIAMISIVEEEVISEIIVKHVSSSGQVTRTKDRKTRARNAFQTTGLSKSRRRQIARKAVKTKRANPSIQTRSLRKRKKALKKRKALGLS
ncbi:head scaffolding protein [Serratia phage 92A1]|nr:head scaffolding protein [Serratia phage 92A1]